MTSFFSMYGMLAGLSLFIAQIWHWADFPRVEPAGFMVAFYQNTIGHGNLDGHACPSWPVCSLYARQALAGHGLLIGSWLILDRLIHENDDLFRGPWVHDLHGKRIYDPLKRNDFWLKDGMT